MSNLHYNSYCDNSVIKSNIIKIANELLSLCSKNDTFFKCFKIPHQIDRIEQLHSNFYVYIYENVCNTELIDKKSPATTIYDQVHNVQAVIDSLSMDVLHEDLSHLTGEAICGIPEPDLVSIEYLLDILRCIHDWISSRLESTIEISNILPQNQYSNQPINGEKTEFNIKKNNSVESSNIILKCESEELNETDQNNNNEPSLKSSNHFSFNNYETRQLINLIDDFENASLTDKIEDLEGSFKEEEDLFQSYMKQKKEEFDRSRYLTNLDFSSINQLNKSSSGKGTLSSASSVNSLEHEDFFACESSRDLKSAHQYKQVKFDSRVSKNIRTRSGSNKTIPEQILMQTINNELKSTNSNVEANSNEEQKRISYLLKSVYNEDLKDAETILKESLLKIKNRSDLTNMLYLNAFNTNNCDEDKHMRPNSGLSTASRSKSVLKPTSRSANHFSKFYLNEREKFQRNRPKSARNAKRVFESDLFKSKSHVTKPNAEFTSRFVIGEDGILNSLLHEFPYLYTSPETIHYLWQKHAKQIETFAKLGKEIEQTYLNKNKSLSNSNLLVPNNASMNSFSQVLNKNQTKPQLKLEETYNKQQKIMEIMRKDIQHMQRMEDMKRKVEVENSMKAKVREQRFQNAKVKRYYEEFRLQQRAKMLKKTTREELIFKNLFNESLKIQKDRILDLKRYAKEKAELSQKQQLNQISSIENFYKNKFDLLNEKLTTEKKNAQIRDKAQHQVLNSMKNKVKLKLESDIKELQHQMSEDKDHIYWREMDAKRVQSDLHKANYLKQAK